MINNLHKKFRHKVYLDDVMIWQEMYLNVIMINHKGLHNKIDLMIQ